jgi:hypothetical protein
MLAGDKRFGKNNRTPRFGGRKQMSSSNILGIHDYTIILIPFGKVG